MWIHEGIANDAMAVACYNIDMIYKINVCVYVCVLEDSSSGSSSM